MTIRTSRIAVVVGAILHALLLLVVVLNTTRWLGTTFPGFFVISNRVVPSIALPDWADGKAARFFQRQVTAVDGEPVASAEAIYARVRTSAPQTPIRYTFRAPDGSLSTADVRTRRFSGTDYTLIFGAFLATAVFFSGAGLLVVFLKPRSPASLGLLATGVTTGLFLTTAADLYGPHWFVRLHVLAEALVAPAFFHLALVFPRERLARSRRRVVPALYLPFLALAVVYELAFDAPSAYTSVHLLATAAHGAGAACIIGVVVFDLVTTRSPLVRRRISVVGLGTLTAFAIPAVTMAASALLGGAVPVNAGAFTAFLFPLSLAYAIVKRDLFEIDVMLRRATTYTMVVVLIAGLYLSALSLLGWAVPGSNVLAQSPATLAILNVIVLFLIAPVQARVQATVDRIFFRQAYDTERVLSDLGHRLVSLHTVDQVVGGTREVLAGALFPASTLLLEWHGDGVLESMGDAGARLAITLPAELTARLARGEVLARYEWDDGTGRGVPAVWHELSAEVLVPIGSGGPPIAALALGQKGSGRPYNVHDIAFLRAAATQVALALFNARAFVQLAAWNATLERQVQERTVALETANADLNRSIAEVRNAYQQLQRNQAILLRSDRLATLGRLTAGIAHEVNTPLGAVLNSLAILGNLSREYAESIDDPRVTPEDHRQIAAELVKESEAAATWARKAAAFIGRVRMHGRDAGSSVSQRFTVATVVAEVQALLAHRVRRSCSRIEFDDDGAALVGDTTRFGQVLINLVSNAIDAYEDANVLDGRIAIAARKAGDEVIVTVRDWAGGIPPEVLPRIFEELFTTKEPGRGTGLGLCIVRNLVEQTFRGALTVDSETGVGTCFTIAVPASAPAQEAPAPTAVVDSPPVDGAGSVLSATG